MSDLFDDVLICVDCGLSAEEFDPVLAPIGGRFLPTGAWVCAVCRHKRYERERVAADGEERA